MFAYRLTKYDPQKRDANGYFTAEEWIGIGDIGETLGGATLSQSEYLEAETAYVTSARTLLAAADIASMRVTDLEPPASEPHVHLDDAVFESCCLVKDRQMVSGVDIENLIRACLRGYLWCRLEGPGGAYVHFGYDYYMYVGVPTSAHGLVLPRGMFLEEIESPYLSLDDKAEPN